MLFNETNYKFMFAALQEAEKAFEENEIPVGAVVVHNNKIIGRGSNQIEKLKDPTAHAEILAITAAANNLSNWRLTDCEIYITLEPCYMCTGAIINSRIETVYFSLFDPKEGACGSIANLAEENKVNHSIKVYSGLYADESKKLMQGFFAKLRSIKNYHNSKHIS